MRKKTGRALAVLFMHLAQMEKAGLPLRQSLETAQKDSDDRAIAALVGALAQSVRGGKSLGAAMAEHPSYFDGAVSGLVTAGEASGKLALVLGKCHDLVIKRLERQSQMKRSTRYAKITGVIILAITTFRQGPDALYTLAFLAALWMAVAIGRRYSPTVRHATDYLVLLLPWLGAVVRQYSIARFCDDLSLLQAGGVEMKKSLHLAGEAMPNFVMRQEAHEALLLVESGASLHQAFSTATRFDRFSLGLIKAGEDSGNFSKTLSEIAAYYEGKTDESITALQQTLVPALIIIFGIMLFMTFRDSGFTAPLP